MLLKVKLHPAGAPGKSLPGPPALVFDGGLLCLDFANTRMISQGRPVDRLAVPTDLAQWLDAAGALDAPGARTTVMAWSARDAAGILRVAHELRDALVRCLEHVVRRRHVPAGPARRLCAHVNALLDTRPVVAGLAYDGHAFRVNERAGGTDPRRALAPVAASIRELLVGGSLRHVRQCDDPACVIYFYDTTKNHSRRWCSMERCGNLAKAAAHQRRLRRSRRGRAGRAPTARR